MCFNASLLRNFLLQKPSTNSSYQYSHIFLICPFAPELTSFIPLSFSPSCHLPGRRGAVGAGVLGALLPGNAGGRGPGMVHPFTRPKQPGGGTAAAAAQRLVRQRSPQQPGGGGGELEMQLTSNTPSFFFIN